MKRDDTMKKLVLLVLLLIIGCTANVELGETTGSSAAAITYITHTNPNGFYSFERPRYWLDKSEGGITEFDGPTKNAVYYTIVVPSIIMPQSLGGDFETKEDYVASLESQWGTAKDYSKLSLGTITVDNKEAAEIVATYTYQGYQYKTRQVVFESDNGFFIRIAYTGPKEGFNDYMPVMDRALETFKILDIEVEK